MGEKKQSTLEEVDTGTTDASSSSASSTTTALHDPIEASFRS